MSRDANGEDGLTKRDRQRLCPCITHDTQGAIHDCIGKPCPCKVTPSEVERLRALLLAATPSRMGCTPDLAWPVGYEGEDPWGEWEADVQVAVFGREVQS